MGNKGSANTSEKLGLMGISVHYLSNQFMREVRNADFDETSKIYDIVDFVIRKKGANVVCPIEKIRGAAYVHSILKMYVGKADIMLSYAWGDSIGDIVDTLVGYCTEANLNQKNTFVWICCLCSNQHSDKIVPLDNFRLVFDWRMKEIGHVLVVMAPWQSPTYLTRVWCLFEIFMATENGCNVTITMPTRERNKFMSSMRSDGGVDQVSNLFTALGSIDITKADALQESHRKNILHLIKNEVGYDNFNVKVSGLMRKWALGVVQAFTIYEQVIENDHSSTETSKWVTFLTSEN